MIEFEDITLIESGGSFEKTRDIMKKDGVVGTWMLRSRVYVHTEAITGSFNLNFWNDGRIIIDDIFRPMSVEVPNDDLSELGKWAVDNGWKLPQPADKLIASSDSLFFWEHQYKSGLVYSPMMEEKENEIINRMEQ